jgi:hypothetical protein
MSMATVSDITNIKFSGLNHIDALLDKGPDWNYLSGTSTLSYTFSVTSGNEQGQTGQQAFSLAQQACVRTALGYITQLTGIQFSETASGTAAQIHFANVDIDGFQVTGLCSWTQSYSYSGSEQTLVNYDADAYVYLDNFEYRAENSNLAPGGNGYETLLHELGHALGLKHPFLESTDPAGTIVLSPALDNTANTLMSYTSSGAARTVYSQYDVAALNWLYGRDGLGGLGVSSASGARYLTGTTGNDVLSGTAADDTLEGDGGNDILNGGAGNDTAVFRGARTDYSFSISATGTVVATSAMDGTDELSSIEVFRFTDGAYQRAQLVSDTTPPAAPKLSVSKNAAGYAMGNAVLVTGEAEANATVKLYSGGNEVGSAQADAHGIWSATTTPFADGMNYLLYAKATDGSGNTSGASEAVFFNVDATAPRLPTGTVSLAAGSNQPVFSGTAEAGTTIQLFRISDLTEIGRATAAANGTWKLDSAPLPNGDYDVRVVSVDQADNATSAATRVQFTVADTGNVAGTANNDLLHRGTGNSAIDGGAGTDIIAYSGAQSNYTLAHDTWGYSVVDKTTNEHDSLINVERVKFGDNSWLALDVDGVAGQAFRLYQAAFDRPAEMGGLGFWIWRMEVIGSTLNEVAADFMRVQEFVDTYGANPSDSDFITHLYNNVLNRAPEGGGYQYWMDVLATHGATRAQVLAFFSESPENQAQVIGTIQDGMAFTPYGV